MINLIPGSSKVVQFGTISFPTGMRQIFSYPPHGIIPIICSFFPMHPVV